MNYLDLQNRAKLLASLEGWTDVSPTPDWGALVNQAWVEFSWDGECIVGNTTFTTVANQGRYSLSGTWKKLTDVVYDSTATKQPMHHTSEDMERFARADWHVQPSGTPVRYTFSPFNSIFLVPPPSTAGITISVRGTTEGTALSSNTDVPPCPDVLHEAIALKAAILQGMVYAQGNSQARLQMFQQRYDKFVNDARTYANFESVGN